MPDGKSAVVIAVNGINFTNFKCRISREVQIFRRQFFPCRDMFLPRIPPADSADTFKVMVNGIEYSARSAAA